MARSCLFTVGFSYAVHLKRGFKFHVFRNYAHVSVKQHEAATEKVAQEIPGNEHEIPGNCKETDLEELKKKILKSSLQFVLEHGWSEKSLALGAKSLGISVAAHTLIKGGGPDLVHYFNLSCNLELEDYLKEVSSSSEKNDLQAFLTDALENRLRMIIPYLPKWPEALALMCLPSQIPLHTKSILELMDSIWHFYGDTSLDMSWYSKRLALAAAYKTAELSLIQDKSEDFFDTFSFIQRRVENVVETENFIHAINENGKQILEFGSGAFIIARNLLGLNSWFR